MSWHVVTLETNGAEARSSAMTEARAIRWARELTSQGVRVLRIESSDGEVIEAEELERDGRRP